MRAIAKPVALDASAEPRETRGFFSTTSISPSAGLIANWMLQPPASTPISRMIARAASRMAWYSTSVSVCEGATVIESPRSEEHTSELQSRENLVCRLLLEKKKKTQHND